MTNYIEIAGFILIILGILYTFLQALGKFTGQDTGEMESKIFTLKGGTGIILVGLGVLLLLLNATMVPSEPTPVPEKTKSQGITVENVPDVVESGKPFKITWRVASNVEHRVEHTAVHYGPESKSEPLSITSYPEISDVKIGLIPATFSSNITINKPGVIYLRAHVMINNVNYWSEEKIIVVSMPVTPTINIVDAPDAVESGKHFKITWRVASNVEHRVEHTAVHYGPESKSEPLSITSYPEISDVKIGLIPATFSSNITINKPGVIYLRAHVMINNVNYWSEEKIIVVSMPVTPTINIVASEYYRY